MKLDVKGRLSLKKIFPGISSGDFVTFMSMKVEEEVLFCITNKMGIIRDEMNSFLDKYIGENEYSKKYLFKSSYVKKVDNSNRINISNVLNTRDTGLKIELENLQIVEGMAVFVSEKKGIFKESILTVID